MEIKGDITDPLLLQLLARLIQLDDEEFEKVTWTTYEETSDSSTDIREHPSGDIQIDF